MSLLLKRNVYASYVSQMYVTVIGILMVPQYIKYMGSEAYGLVGFFTMFQTWFQLLDAGLTPAMAREVAWYKGGQENALSIRKLLRTLETLFLCIGTIAVIGIFISANIIADKWLKVSHLPITDVAYAVVLMGIIAALRWISGLYRGTISGTEKLVWLSTWAIITATMRFVLVIPFLIYEGATVRNYFNYQLVVAIIDTAGLIIKAYQALPKIADKKKVKPNLEALKPVLKFVINIAFTHTIWLLVTQTDKVILSRSLSLEDYGYFTLAILVASGISLISSPIYSALSPRLTRLSSLGNDNELLRIYRKSTQITCILVIPSCAVLAIWSEQFLWAWTGNNEIAIRAAPILSLYAAGNAIHSIGSIAYYLQVAKGDLKLHTIGSLLYLVILVPAVVISVNYYGIMGAAYSWLIANILYFLVWLPRIHDRFYKKLHKSWLVADVIPTLLVVLTLCLFANAVTTWHMSRAMVGITLAILSIIMLLGSILSSSTARESIQEWRLKRTEPKKW